MFNLTPVQQKYIIQNYSKMTAQQIATNLKIPPSNVRNQITYLRKILKEEIIETEDPTKARVLLTKFNQYFSKQSSNHA